MGVNIKQYIPEFYERDYGDTNTVSHIAELFTQINNDIHTQKFNNYDDEEVIKKEFKVSELITSGFKVRDISFLKAFFAFKGTNGDLQYILNNIGYESVIYNDGGYAHKNLDGTERVIPVNTFYGDKISNPRCQIEIKVIIDLNTGVVEGYSGYTGIDLARIRDICQERLDSCSYLSKIYVELSAKESYDTMQWTSDYMTIRRYLPDFSDEYFTEYKYPEIAYGEEFNDALKYGKEHNDSLAYGRHNQILFKPLADRLIFHSNNKLPEDAMGINDGAGGTINLGDSFVVEVNKNHYETYTYGIYDDLTIKTQSTKWIDGGEYPSTEMVDSLTIGIGKTYRFIENPDAYYYGKEHNVGLKYGENKGADDYGTKDDKVISYGEKPKNQGTESPALSINSDDPNAIINLNDSVEIQVVKKTKL